MLDLFVISTSTLLTIVYILLESNESAYSLKIVFGYNDWLDVESQIKTIFCFTQGISTDSSRASHPCLVLGESGA